ncbi:unnamed protein product [Acanthoscelides obtectus]|uniref:DDE Tnp4 domain-containing protein n=2 Tax=Acanthoscelides obtectus TaxID=200917 RepID=A0A9P0Q2E1_ACAOB|nr:unnamed protein product [Acanthoscelides obtectus]CAK1622447.1 Protein ALP1-like [Acanthoscelides obtectus]
MLAMEFAGRASPPIGTVDTVLSGEWLCIEKGFARKFPLAIGSIDGKHIVLDCPFNSGSEYYNYKRTYSIVLLALVDSHYNFIFADIGCQGRISDGGVFTNTLLWNKICTNSLNLPPPHPLPGSNIDVPYIFLGDGAFALSEHLMKPYPGQHNIGSEKREFNKRLSSARVVVENTFGMMTARFRVFRMPIPLQPEKATLITMTCILLHNFLRRSSTSSCIYTPPGFIDIYDDDSVLIQPGSWRKEQEKTCAIRNLRNVARRSPKDATEIRNEFTKYLSNV